MQRLSLDDRSIALKKHPQYKHAKTNELKRIVCMKMFPNLTLQEVGSIVGNIRLLEASKGEE